MPTKLFLRNTQQAQPNVDLSVIGVSEVRDLLIAAGAALDTAVVNTVASGTEIIFTKTAGGNTVAWVSGRVPAGGFTLTTTDISAWLRESNMNANCGGRYRVYKYTPGSPATLTELGGGPFNDGVEFGTASAEMTWPGNVTDMAFAENDRIVIKLFITNIGTMGGGFTCTLDFNAADATTGDSFFNIAENVTFKFDEQTVSPSGIVSAEAFGTSRLDLQVAGAGAVASAEAFGADRVDLVVTHVILDDTFDRANSVNLGIPWVESEFSTSTIEIQGFPAGKCRTLNALTPDGIATVDRTFKNDQWAEAEFNQEVTPDPTFTAYAGIFVRGSGTFDSFTGYGFLVRVVNGVVQDMLLKKWVAETLGAGTVLATITPAPIVGDLLAIEVQVTRIVVYKNNVVLRTVTDSAIASGKAGILAFAQTPVVNNYLEWDNFGAGDLMTVFTQEVFGTPTLSVAAGPQEVSPGAIASAEAFGLAAVGLTLNPVSISTAEAFGSARVDLSANPSGIASAEALGTSRLDLNITPGGSASAEAFGMVAVSVTGGYISVAPQGVPSAEAFGVPDIGPPLVLRRPIRRVVDFEAMEFEARRIIRLMRPFKK